jgi:nitrogen fixation protein FixH
MSTIMPTPRATDARGRRPRELTGRMVLICLIGFFGVVAGANAVMIHAALSTFGGVETQSSYQAGKVFEREVSIAHAQDALHWQVTASVKPAADATLVDVVARDASGKPLGNLTAHAQLVHPADSRFDRDVPLVEQAPGRFHAAIPPAPGQWDLVIELTRGGERMFRSKNRITVQ